MLRELLVFRSSTLGLLAAILGASCSAPPAAPPHRVPSNLDFEEGRVGRIPPGWHSSSDTSSSGYRMAVSAAAPHSGSRCAEIAAEDDPRGFGTLMQTLDATPYRGRRVRFRAAVRAEVRPAQGHGELWMRVDRPAGSPGFFQNMVDRPIVERGWQEYEIVGEVADDAATIHFGGFLAGRGRIWIDAASFESIGRAGEGNQPPRALTRRGLENLVAFTRLLGYVRFFHPSDAAAQTDWDTFAIRGVDAVEDAASSEDLAARLERVFRPIAPTLRVVPSGRTPEVPRELLPPVDGPAPRITGWRHLGLGLQKSSIYRSRRIDDHTPLRDGPAGLPAPAETFTADLGGGVTGRVPLSLYTSPLGATIPSTPKPVLPPSSHPGGWIPSGNDRATRLADVALSWTVLQHFYPYFDVVPVDWPAVLATSLQAAAVDPDDQAFKETLERLLAPLHDGHGDVSHGGGLDAGFLPLALTWAQDRLLVVASTRAVEKLVWPGDAIVAIGGEPVEDTLHRIEERISGATPLRRRYLALKRLGTGAPGEKVDLTVETPEGERKTVSLARVSWDKRPREPRPEEIAEVRLGVWYVNLDWIEDKDFQKALPRLAAARGIIFDLRGYPDGLSTVVLAHLIDAPVDSAHFNMPIVTRPDHRDLQFRPGDWSVAPEEPRLRAKVAFLTDERAISYAETYLGIVEHYHLGEIVGRPTAGTNGDVNPIQLPGGYGITWTGMQVLKHDGSRHHGVGILPTIPAEPTREGLAAGRDDVLERAISAVMGEGSASR